MTRTSWWNDDDIHFVLDQHTELDFIDVLSIAIARPGTILPVGKGNNSYNC